VGEERAYFCLLFSVVFVALSCFIDVWMRFAGPAGGGRRDFDDVGGGTVAGEGVKVGGWAWSANDIESKHYFSCSFSGSVWNVLVLKNVIIIASTHDCFQFVILLPLLSLLLLLLLFFSPQYHLFL